MNSFYEFDEILAGRPTPHMPSQIPPPSPIQFPPPPPITMLSALEMAPSNYMWVHVVKPEFAAGIVELIHNLAANKVSTFIIFRTKHDEVMHDTSIMHVCSISAKQSCRCALLNDKLIKCTDKRVNCNYMQSNKIASLLFCLILLKNNVANIVVNSLVINKRRYSLDDFTQDIARQLGCTNCDFDNLIAYRPDDKLQKKWEKITYGTHYNVAPAHFAPTDVETERALEHANIDAQLNGTADLSLPEEKFLSELNDPNVAFIEKLLWRYLPIPLTHLHMVHDVSQSVYHNLKSSHSAYSNALDNFSGTMDNMEIADLFALLRDAKIAPRFSVFSQYRSRVDSANCIEKWLRFQFEERVNVFVKDLFHIVMRSNGKKNCLWVHGAGNAGKTYVLKSLATLFIAVGHIKSINEVSQFPFQGLFGKRVALLDEFKIPSKYEDEFKELFAGESLAINCKFKKGLQSTHPMPFLCMSNNPPNVDMTNVVWNSRIAEYNVRTLPADLFSFTDLQLYPLAWFDVFAKFGFIL